MLRVQPTLFVSTNVRGPKSMLSHLSMSVYLELSLLTLTDNEIALLELGRQNAVAHSLMLLSVAGLSRRLITVDTRCLSSLWIVSLLRHWTLGEGVPVRT